MPSLDAAPHTLPRPTLSLWGLLLIALATALCLQSPASAVADEEIADDRYPLLPLQLLEQDERAMFLKIAQAELCPCEGIFDSLDACLQREDGGCPLARRVSVMAMRKIKEGESQSDVVDEIVKTVERARKVYEFGDLSKTPHKGAAPEAAKVTIVEFADFECPYCARASKAVKEVIEAHGGEVAVYFKQFPLPMHEHADFAARASLAAHRQGKFWPMHDWLMENQKTFTPDLIIAQAQAMGLDVDRFKDDVDSDEIKDQVAADLELGIKSDLTGTPTFFLNGVLFDGGAEDLMKSVEDRLEK